MNGPFGEPISMFGWTWICWYDLEKEREMGQQPVTLQAEVKREGVTIYERTTGNIDREAVARLV